MNRISAMVKSFELGLEDQINNRPEKTGKQLTRQFWFVGQRIRDEKFLRNAYSAGRFEVRISQ